MNDKRRFHRPAGILLGALLALSGAMTRAQAPEANEGLTETLHTVKLRRGSELSILISKRTGATPSIAALLFPGSPGILKLREEAGSIRYDLAGNFLLRARRHLSTAQLFTVVIDCPADQWTACDDRYRSSRQHAEDIAEVVNAVRQDLGAKQVYLVGTSYGTVSSSLLAKALEDRIDGAVHTATFTDPRPTRNAHGVPMRSFDWSLAKAPQLFVHHKDDACNVTRYASVVARRKDLPLITVEGGDPPRSKPCQARSAHGFLGRERAVMSAIGDWIVERRLVPLISEEK